MKPIKFLEWFSWNKDTRYNTKGKHVRENVYCEIVVPLELYNADKYSTQADKLKSGCKFFLKKNTVYSHKKLNENH